MLSIQCAHTAPHTRSSLRTPGRPAWPPPWSPPHPARRPPSPELPGAAPRGAQPRTTTRTLRAHQLLLRAAAYFLRNCQRSFCGCYISAGRSHSSWLWLTERRLRRKTLLCALVRLRTRQGQPARGSGGLSVSKGRARGPFTAVSFRSHVDGPRGERLRFPVPLFHHARPPFPSAPHGPERLHQHQPSHLYSRQSEGRKGKTRCASF